MKIVLPQESTADTQPHVQPAVIRSPKANHKFLNKDQKEA